MNTLQNFFKRTRRSSVHLNSIAHERTPVLVGHQTLHDKSIFEQHFVMADIADSHGVKYEPKIKKTELAAAINDHIYNNYFCIKYGM